MNIPFNVYHFVLINNTVGKLFEALNLTEKPSKEDQIVLALLLLEKGRLFDLCDIEVRSEENRIYTYHKNENFKVRFDQQIFEWQIIELLNIQPIETLDLAALLTNEDPVFRNAAKKYIKERRSEWHSPYEIIFLRDSEKEKLKLKLNSKSLKKMLYN